MHRIRRLTSAVGERTIILLLVLVYLGAMATLAVTVDRRFFINDVVSAVVWIGFGLALLTQGFLTSRR